MQLGLILDVSIRKKMILHCSNLAAWEREELEGVVKRTKKMKLEKKTKEEREIGVLSRIRRGDCEVPYFSMGFEEYVIKCD